jgi:hypothetical protein
MTRSAQERLGSDETRVRAFAKSIGLQRPDAGKIEMFGILTGEADDSVVESLRGHADVEFVERDAEQRAIGGG